MMPAPLVILVLLIALILFGRYQLKRVAKQALSKLVSEIHLEPVNGYVFSKPDVVNRHEQTLAALNYSDAGTYAVKGIDGLVVRFFTNQGSAPYTVIYDHPKKELLWINLVLLFADDTSVTLTDMPSRGLTQPPAHAIIHCPGADFKELHERAREYLTQKKFKPLTPEAVPAEFERAYAEGLAWRKQQGISIQEVANVQRTRPRT